MRTTGCKLQSVVLSFIVVLSSANYRRKFGFNGALTELGAAGVLLPAASAMLHNLPTLGVSLRSMTNLLDWDLSMDFTAHFASYVKGAVSVCDTETAPFCQNED